MKRPGTDPESGVNEESRTALRTGLRRAALGHRGAQPPDQAAAKSEAACRRLMALDIWRAAGVVMAYCDFRGEVATGPLFEACRRQGKALALPVTVRRPRRLIPRRVDRPDQLVRGEYGIREPAPDCPPVDPALIDLVVVPGVAFDPLGNRLGYGAGYYDRFLCRVRPDCPACGLAFEFQVVSWIPASPADVPLDFVVTEARVIDAGRGGESGRGTSVATRR